MNDADQKRFFNLSDITTRIQQIFQPYISKHFWIKAEILSGRERDGSFYCDLIETEANEDGKITTKHGCDVEQGEPVRSRF